MRKRLAKAPKTKASPRPATMVAIRGVSCGIVYGAPFEINDVGWERPKGPPPVCNMVGRAAGMQPPAYRNRHRGASGAGKSALRRQRAGFGTRYGPEAAF